MQSQAAPFLEPNSRGGYHSNHTELFFLVCSERWHWIHPGEPPPDSSRLVFVIFIHVEHHALYNVRKGKGVAMACAARVGPETGPTDRAKLEEIFRLSDKNWDGALDEVRFVHAHLCCAMSVPCPW